MVRLIGFFINGTKTIGEQKIVSAIWVLLVNEILGNQVMKK